MTAKLSISIGQHSDQGVKDDNEDFHGFTFPDEPQLTYKGIAVAIADGMSGSDAGKVASQASVVGFLADYFSTPDSWSVKQSAERILSATNSWMYSNGYAKYQSAKGLVCTLSVLVFKSHSAHLFHVGDSRIYRLRKQNLERLTQDHRIWGDSGKSYLSRAMGIEPHLNVDYKTFPLEANDIFVLTTDGVHDFIDDKVIKKTLLENGQDFQQAAERLVTKALDRDSDDNATCQVLRVESLPLAESDEIGRLSANRPFPPPLEKGMILDGYRVEEELHASKRTQVYRCYDTVNDRTVILKTPSVNYQDDPIYIEHFLHEEWVGRRLNHTNILQILEDDRPRQCVYYVTEYIDGLTLRQWMDRNHHPDIGKVYNIVEQVAKGLGALHRMEMVHQDLKPENIMIDTDHTVKIIDFGSVKIAGIEEIKKNNQEDPVLGTLNYTAPEFQTVGRGDARSDIFSLAAITYEMLNGALPFGGDMPEKADRIKLARLQYVASIEHNPMVPIWMDGAIKKALSINPIQRYEATSEFIYDLKRPNKRLVDSVAATTPLIQRNPLLFWRSLCAIQLFVILALLYFVVR